MKFYYVGDQLIALLCSFVRTPDLLFVAPGLRGPGSRLYYVPRQFRGEGERWVRANPDADVVLLSGAAPAPLTRECGGVAWCSFRFTGASLLYRLEGAELWSVIHGPVPRFDPWHADCKDPVLKFYLERKTSDPLRKLAF